MTIQTCKECSHEYDNETVVIPTPIPDKMCFNCGTILTDEEINALIQKAQAEAEAAARLAAEQTEGA
jgi:hypothetical protein